MDDGPLFEVFEDAGAWHWRLLDADRMTLARSIGGYPSADDARDAAHEFRLIAKMAMITTVPNMSG